MVDSAYRRIMTYVSISAITSPFSSNWCFFILLMLPFLGFAQGKGLLLDFGANAQIDSLIASPASQEGAVVDGVWNQVERTDITAGLVYSDGLIATGVSLYFGTGAYASIVDFRNKPTASQGLGTTIKTGVYAENSVGRDGVLSNDEVIAVQIRGLGAGVYDIYLTGRNTDVSTDVGELWVGSGSSSSGIFNIPTANGAHASLANNNSKADNAVWVEGDNYAVINYRLEAGKSLYIANNSLYLSGDEARGFLNSIEIVPSTLAEEPPEPVYSLIKGRPLLERVR